MNLPIRRARFRHYRSLRDLDLVFGGITVLVGPTNTGKSNFVRALHDWAFNRSGNDCVSWKQDATRVAVTLDDDTVILWQKGARHNAYVIEREDEREVMERVGLYTPPEVSEVTHCWSVYVDDSMTFPPNFAKQDDNWFLIGGAWNSTSAARFLSLISGLDRTTLALKLAQRKVVGYHTEWLSRKRERERLEARLASFPDPVEAEAALKRVEATARTIAFMRATLDQSHELKRRISSRAGPIAAGKKKLSTAKRILKSIDLEGFERLCSSHDRLATLHSTIRSRTTEIVRTGERVLKIEEQLKGANELLADLARSMTLCPVCLGPAHPECSKRIVREAKAILQE